MVDKYIINSMTINYDGGLSGSLVLRQTHTVQQDTQPTGGIYVVGFDTDTITTIDYTTGDTVGTTLYSTLPSDLAGINFVNGGLWGIGYNSTDNASHIFELDLSGNVVQSTQLSGSIGNCTALAYDGQYLWVSDYTLGRVRQIDFQGNEQTNFPVNNPRGIVYHAGSLWVVSYGDRYVYNYSTGGVLLASYALPNESNGQEELGGQPSGLTWNGSNFVMTDYSYQKLYTVDANFEVVSEVSHGVSLPVSCLWVG